MTWDCRHVSVPVDRPPADVAAFAGDPANLPLWAGGLSSGIRREGDRWLTDSPMGVVEVAFVGPVELGILDHDVTLPDGTVAHNPLRVLHNDRGSEVVFTLYRLPGVSDEELDRDAALVAEDLGRLQALLEQ
ncbi:MAG: polyketide cyclase [Cellulomonas sp. 73-145]|uniref:SRPBCC family protein n=1 Tax=Cellulomonas sp. 73-145 TaxID=1895739 RepID=UPI0009265266|nr:SRPBCC family protein [Cellulomonas sp. 73-145]MBN9328526.1 SRPBCC family protein [Cellulomonas sp.]OJV60116.1 MAG: polyketide cyclase [Cellulomonas sp. 73-145]